MENKGKSAMAITGFVLAIIAALLSAVPIVNNFAFVLAVLGFVFGIIGVVKIKKGKSGGMGIAVAAIIIALIAVGVVLATQAMYGKAVDDAAKSINESADKMTGEKTDDLLKTDVDVELGKFEATKDEYGIDSTKLLVTIKNKNTAKKSYTVQIEAVDAGGTRILDDTVYANDLGADQTQQFEAFKFVESTKIEALKTAEFKIVKVGQL